ncbi:hypothetical protein HNE05_12905 [Aquipseudomonas campi]|uniref:Uncharacterized protein n=1 Tax=Aquipseudomonas campi TaxID=2731681 RepID=A0A6M8FA77_9GAMM|nr:hypothetical protein [Pseudomonas campi]QKE64211.1 hypothetical protein HNE05_12905 [Pseudomonas campi]
MSVEEKQLTPSRAASSAELLGEEGASSTALALVGLSVVQPERAPLPYAQRWFRAWEGELYRRAVRKTGRRQWDLSRFSVDGGPEANKAGYRETLAAVGQAAKQALAAAEASCGRRSSRERLALVYSDFWGQCSHLEHAFNWRDGFDLDVIPKFLLREHAVDGYSCKVQAGRSGFVQSLRVAGELLNGGDIDSVLLGGVFRFYPALGFSEAIGNAEQERRWLGKGGQHDAPIIERAGFIVLKRAEAALKAKTAPVLLGAPQYLAVPARREDAAAALRQAWSALLPEPRAIIYGGHYPSSLLAAVEGSAAAAMGDQLVYENLCRRFGDSGGINPLLALQRYAERKAAGHDGVPAVLSLSDSHGGTWMLRCQ